MEVLEVTFILIGIFVYLGLVVLGFVSWMGMHNNTVDGNSFRLIYPFVVFDRSQFTDAGNYWRRRHLAFQAVVVVFTAVYYAVRCLV